MTGFTIKESFGDLDIEYQITKNGAHSGAINGFINGSPIIEDLNFTTAHELCSALHRAQLAVLSRANQEAITKSALGSEGSQHFIQYAVEHLKRMSMGAR
jgi:hypothetical protein